MKKCILTQLLVWFLRDPNNFFCLLWKHSFDDVGVRCVYENVTKWIFFYCFILFHRFVSRRPLKWLYFLVNKVVMTCS